MKKFIIALMAFALVITLAGCGGGGGGGSSFVLDRGDNGKWLKNNGFEDVYQAYVDINSVFKSNTSSTDKDGEIRGEAFEKCISKDYKGASNYSSDVSTKTKLVERLKSLIKNKSFEGLEIIPFGTQNGADKDTVTEKTKLYVASFKHNGHNYTDKEYVFDKVKWVKEEENGKMVWKIVSGFDDLGKSASELAGI